MTSWAFTYWYCSEGHMCQLVHSSIFWVRWLAIRCGVCTFSSINHVRITFENRIIVSPWVHRSVWPVHLRVTCPYFTPHVLWITLNIEVSKVSYSQLKLSYSPMGLLPDTWNCGLCMRRECRERFPRHRLQKKPLVSDPDMHHGACVTHMPAFLLIWQDAHERKALFDQ